jgi:hypothetical protein
LCFSKEVCMISWEEEDIQEEETGEEEEDW